MAKNISKKYPQVYNDPDFIVAPKYNNSLAQFLHAHPNGVSVSTICRILKITIEEYEQIHNCAIMKLRHLLKVRPNDT